MTERGGVVRDRLVLGRAGMGVDFRVRVVRRHPDRIREEARNRVAAVLSVLISAEDPVELTLLAIRCFCDCPGPSADIPRLLPFLVYLANLAPQQQSALDRRLRERSDMVDITAVRPETDWDIIKHCGKMSNSAFYLETISLENSLPGGNLPLDGRQDELRETGVCAGHGLAPTEGILAMY